jgi:cysteinyl-tRNA synthetase
MSLRVYNTLTKQKELFEPVHPGKVGIYVCGPTVYKPPHIGHMVGPVIFDAVKRYLLFKGFEVTWVVNITDVDDKLIDQAAAEKTTVADVAQRCTKDYLDALAALGVDTVDRFPKASEHMEEIIALTRRLIDQGFAYAADGNVWFDVTRDQDYGKLSHRRPEEQESGTRDLQGSGKRNPADFALWKKAKPGEPTWESPWGPGRPGWHIECSAMSMKYLGERLDIHGGGMDLMFPHHENELAQSESATGQTFAKYWMHNGLTRIKTKVSGGQVKAEKMSKSLGNVIDAKTAIAEFGPDLLRYLILSTHYRSPIDFGDEVVAASRKGLATFTRLVERIDRLLGEPLSADKTPSMDQAAGGLYDTPHGDFARAVLAFKMKFLEMMDDDFNTAGAIAALHELAGAVNSFIESNRIEKDKQPDALAAAAAATLSFKQLATVLGFFRAKSQPAATGAAVDDGRLALVDDLMKVLIAVRREARESKNFATADSIRKHLSALGITLEDRAEGTIWRKD